MESIQGFDLISILVVLESMRNCTKPSLQPNSAEVSFTVVPGEIDNIVPLMAEPNATTSATLSPSQRWNDSIDHGLPSDLLPSLLEHDSTTPITLAFVRNIPIRVNSASDFTSIEEKAFSYY